MRMTEATTCAKAKTLALTILILVVVFLPLWFWKSSTSQKHDGTYVRPDTLAVTTITSVIGNETQPTMTTPSSVINNVNTDGEEDADCLQFRGRSGQWVQDIAYATAAQYKTPLTKWSEFDFVPNAAIPYRNASTYKWVDDISSCPVDVLSLDSFCAVVTSQLHVSRIMFVGDSVTLQMAESLWKLLGSTDDPTDKPHDKQWARTVSCPASNSSFNLNFYRNDHLDGSNETSEGELEHRCIKPRDAFCTGWINDYINYDIGEKTLLIANFGAHVHKIATFEEEMNDFVELLDRYQKPNDVVMFRTTVPGHRNCQQATGPYSSYDEFATTLKASPRSWHLFARYNDYGKSGSMIMKPCAISSKHEHRSNIQPFHTPAKSAIQKRNQDGVMNKIHLLDVFPMTVLRPDGHRSGPQKCISCPVDDCLHYILEGPPDWWNHLLYSNLLSLAAT